MSAQIHVQDEASHTVFRIDIKHHLIPRGIAVWGKRAAHSSPIPDSDEHLAGLKFKFGNGAVTSRVSKART